MIGGLPLTDMAFSKRTWSARLHCRNFAVAALHVRANLRNMSWRRVVRCCCLGVSIGCASGHAVEVTPCETVTSMRPRRLYLGDGITDYHYYPILDYLRENPGSESNTRVLEDNERAAAQRPHDLKPPSANIAESEFSHLLGAIARDNGGIGAAVFDTTGLKVGAAGLQMEGLVLPADRLAELEKAPEDLPVEVRYTCSKLRELAKMFAKDCKGPITVYYRPVIDHRRDSRLLGFSMLVVQNEPPCKDARR
jgi:hypothetical protein